MQNTSEPAVALFFHNALHRKPFNEDRTMAKREGMTISELEKISGVSRSTIHHYVNYGLLHKPYKTGQTMAYYDQSHVKRLDIIQKIKLDYLKSAKTSRVPLDLIKHKISEGYSLVKDSSAPVKSKSTGQKEKIQKKKEEIIEATLRLYSNRGYYLTNIRDIAREVGISAPTFYHYFMDKRELFAETIEYVINNFKKETQIALAEEKDPVRRTTLMFEIFASHYPKIGEILNQLRSGAILGDPWAKEKLSAIYGQLMENVTREIKGAMKAGIIREVDPELLAFFNVLLDEVAMTRASMDNKYSIEDVIKFVADMLYHAFLTEKGKALFGPYDQSRSFEG
ncbi:MAG: TetR family transcriptional regulator [Desulfobacteraceae bacterium]|nr:TetR family transcriptional regulator [Desulfobacteraceae bacterium]